MKMGMFQTPFLGPERTPAQVFDWAVQQGIAAEKAGFEEYWVGEHATLNWEAIPSPELVISALVRETSRIKLGPLAHLLPYHHPATLAVQTAWLSHILQGRYQLGVAAGAYPTDAAMRGLTDLGENHKMMFEALEIMEKVWAGKPFQHDGAYWKAGLADSDPGHPLRDQRPWGGAMPMAMTGLSPNSPSIRFAAERGWIPASVYSGNAGLIDHFNIYAETAAKHGHKADRSVHRVVRDVFVADTDAEARKLAIEGGMGRAWREYLLPVYHAFGIFEGLLERTGKTKADVDGDFLADHMWIVGSPETVREKIEQWCDELGGPFGTLMIYSYDYIDNPTPWEESMQRLAQEITPRIGARVPA
ncbi:MAG: LLM class flavin-dependent oxidoreductase [Novosphingobium sp.]|uniref:LLM class flavin-dependent oxidoreductase n=1 Tax=Tsuneonella sp. CC-YZS046 TaxID=3042152 RepID=UPI002D76D4CD|nr:LLM class flavin-dependent oxidoreductase [Tsuneonella sp. CC-YZS046]WRO66364.1 LLM class flavin-dependent oxidoreductase [Tsuneonella sp. CC-YZS046]